MSCVFFVFKQKTAYEMRISDWSSDVCSSDLLNDGAGLLKPETARMMHDFYAPGTGPLNTMALGFYEQWVNGHRAIAHGGDTEWFHSYLWLFPDAEIGRASCRDRGCQYV